MSNPHTAVVLYLEERLQELEDLLTDPNRTDAEREQTAQTISVVAQLLDSQRLKELAEHRKPVQAAEAESQTSLHHAPGQRG